MKYIVKILSVLCIIALLMPGCSDFDEINTNPNSTEQVTPAMLATNLILGIVQTPTAKTFAQNNMASKQLAWGESADGNQYNDFGRTGFSPYLDLVNVQKMIDYTTDTNRDAYTGLGLFVRAYKLFYLSIEVGDIPYSDALGGETGNTTPKYDTQKQVMVQVLKDLENAEKHFAVAKNFDGDPALKGNVATWRRVVNSFRLKVLMFLSKKESDTDLSIKAAFAQIVANNPILESNAQNLQIVFSNKAKQIYPINKVNNNHYGYGMLTNVLVDNLKRMNDYRLFYYGEPSVYSTTTDKIPADSWDAYPGVDPSMVHSDLVILYNAKKFSGFNSRYIDYEPGEPVMRVGFTEQNFIIAEAIVRGWMSGNAKDYYEAGIRAAMNTLSANTPETYTHNHTITASYIDSYLAGTEVAFASTANDQLKQIWMQKYILYFLQHPWDSYYEYRRTGYPVLPINPETNRNEVKDKIPVRWMYPQKEYNMNLDNLTEALTRQYSGQDKVNDLMWILQ